MMILQNILKSLFIFSLFAISLASQTVYSQDFDCNFTQITDTLVGDIGDVRTNSDGTLLVFASDRDLTGSNADGNFEIFLYDVNTSTFMQVTDTMGDNNSGPRMNANGLLVVFTSENDITGDNADSNSELFLLNTETLTITQLTDTTGGSILSARFPTINSNGTHVAFTSNKDYTGENADGNPEVFLLDINALIFTQITDTTGPASAHFVGISNDGTIVSFTSSGDLTGNNMDLSQELFIYNANTDTITQVTDSTDSTILSNRFSSVSPDGSLVVFESDLDLTGSNPDGILQIYLYDILADSITQITMTDISAIRSKFSADGSFIIFSTNADITGDNPENTREIFLYDLSEDTFLQYTVSTGVNSFDTTFNSDLAFLATTVDSDITGDNPDENRELFIAECRAVIQGSDNGGNGGCSLAPSGNNLSNLSLLMLLPVLILFRRLIKRK